MVIKQILAEKIKKAPLVPGVYIFKNKIGEILYIGKAINLRRRLLYYTKNKNELFYKTAKFLSKTEKLLWIKVSSDLEALLLEMNLIRTLKPKYNSLSKDDKRPLFVWITKDKFPRVKTSRVEISGKGDFVGPFPSTYKLKEIMKKLRHIFPYCSCNANRKKPCLFKDLGLCNPSPVDIKTKEEAKIYWDNIRKIKLFLNGKIEKVEKILRDEMKFLSDNLEYEKALKVKSQIEDIKSLLLTTSSIDLYLKDNLISGKVAMAQTKALANLLKLPFIHRIEGYDIANTSGTNPTASMVVFENGLPNTNEFRKFKIKTSGPNDPMMIKEVLERRIDHLEWEYPQLILVDGGKTQVSKAYEVLGGKGIKIKIIGLAKRFEHIILKEGNEFRILALNSDSLELTLLKSVRDEAHRFTTNYHIKLREREMLEKQIK